jgi:hypothetical protein
MSPTWSKRAFEVSMIQTKLERIQVGALLGATVLLVLGACSSPTQGGGSSWGTTAGTPGTSTMGGVGGAPWIGVQPRGGSAGVAGSAGSSSTACSVISQRAENQRAPVDIVFALDNSGSMDEEAVWVQSNMNDFSRQIVAAAIDVRVIVISSYPGEGNGICVDAPLGSGGCPKADTKPPAFLHVDQRVASHDALELIVSTYPRYASTLRPNSTKHVIVVSDDESDWSATEAKTEILALAPPMFQGFVFHGIFSYTDGMNDHCEGLAAAAGEQYKRLVADTGGVSGDLCLQDFKPVFDRIARAVVGGSRLACEWSLPAPPAGTTFDPKLTNVRVGGSALPSGSVPRVASKSDCGAAPNGRAWYYDNEARPTKIFVCDAICQAIQGDASAQVDIEFGCPTIDVPVR